MHRTLLAMLLLFPALATAAVTVRAPASVGVGQSVSIAISGSTNREDFVSILPKGAAAGAWSTYAYVDGPGPFTLAAPTAPGEYEVRVLGAVAPHPTLARAPLRVEAVTVTLDAPAQVPAGKPFKVRWKGPNNERDYVAIGNASQPYINYAYTSAGAELTITAPDAPGDYEIRYLLGQDDSIIGRRRIVVGGVSASVAGPGRVAAGASFAVTWQGPNNERDYVTLVKAGAPEGTYGPYAMTADGAKPTLRAPDEPGAYELRYVTGQTGTTLARAPLEIGAVNASVAGPPQATAGTAIDVRWTGPANPGDYVAIVRKGTPDVDSGGEYALVAAGKPARVNVPLVAGDYEIRYVLGQSFRALARAPLVVVPGAQPPGTIVVAALAAAPGDRPVHVILDASGSMLQRLGGQRRIEIARGTLTTLATRTLPAGTPFALRAFGREENSCRTDLVMPLAPLDRTAAAKTLATLEAKNGARTAIGASLEQVATDLKAARGERVAIVVTDGEETCAGDPAAAVRKLAAGTPRTVVHFVGFAVDDAKVAAGFRRWATLGGGSYFDARDGAALDRALAQAVQPSFELVDAAGRVIARGRAGGDPVQAPPGSYTVRFVGAARPARPVVVKAAETVTVAP